MTIHLPTTNLSGETVALCGQRNARAFHTPGDLRPKDGYCAKCGFHVYNRGMRDLYFGRVPVRGIVA